MVSVVVVVELDAPGFVSVVVVFDASAGDVVVVLVLLGGVVLVVVDEEVVELGGGVSAGFTSTFVLVDAGGVVTVSVFVQPTAPMPTARRAASRYDGFIVGFPSFGGWIKEALADSAMLHCNNT